MRILNLSSLTVDEVEVDVQEAPINHSVAPCSSFDTSLLPSVLKDYVDSIASVTAAHPIMIVATVLADISAFMQRARYIPPFDPHTGQGDYFSTLYPNLWVLMISPSGLFKTTALNRGNVLSHEREAEIQEEKREDTQSVILPHRVTAEALLEHLSRGYGGAIYCSEFAAWLKGLERTYNQDLKALLTELYDVPQVYRYKTKTQGNHSIARPFISICGVSTLEWVQENIRLEDVASGFFARFLLFYPPHEPFVPPALPEFRGYVDPDSKRRVKEVLENLPPDRAYRLGEDSKEYFRGLHGSLYSRLGKCSDSTQRILQPYLKRWSPYLLKLAMLLQPFVDAETDEIGTEALDGAAFLVDDAMDSTIWLFENELGESAHQRKCRKVYEYIEKKGGCAFR